MLACLGSVARAVTGVAGGATRMALTQHFALRRNAADIAAKEGSQVRGCLLFGLQGRFMERWMGMILSADALLSLWHSCWEKQIPHALLSACPPLSIWQETATTLIGMVLGMAFTRAASSAGPLVVWAAFCLLTGVHVWANVRAMRCLRMTSLNRPRLHQLLRSYLCSGAAPSPPAVAASEPLLAPPLARALEVLRLRPPAPAVNFAPSIASLVSWLQAPHDCMRGRPERSWRCLPTSG